MKKCCGIAEKKLCSCAELLFLHKALDMAAKALETHMCPEDGSTDTVCYPDNWHCPARQAVKLIQKGAPRKTNV